MYLLHYRTTLLSSALLPRSFSDLVLPRQVYPLRIQKMNSINDGLTTSSKPAASPATPSGISVIPSDDDSVLNCGHCCNISDNRSKNCQTIWVGSIPILCKLCYPFTPIVSGSRSEQLVPRSPSGPTDHTRQCSSLSADAHFNKRKAKIDLISKENVEDAGSSSNSKNIGASQLESSNFQSWMEKSQMEKLSLPTHFGKKLKHRRAEKSYCTPRNFKYPAAAKNSGWSKGLHYHKPFDICLSGSRSFPHEASLHAREIEFENEAEGTAEFTNPTVLRPGMVLLKNFVTLSEQVEIVKQCRELGKGPGGFYQPEFQCGAKLRLQMMCLGLNWDPETKKYDDRRPIDGTRPPGIPPEFSLLVNRAIQEAHAQIEEELRVCRPEEVLPSMSPNICIANFYTTSGRLGLHQDRDESTKSLQQGLPVVSISIGDSADFLYGDQRDIEKAKSVVLESGDVLIFGGRSRHIFHGVSSIIPDTAPYNLLEETKLRPGRLNLTFRQY